MKWHSPREKGAEWHEAEVCGIEEIKEFAYGSRKVTFECDFGGGKKRRCVYWSQTFNPQVGDQINICGWDKDIFLVSTLKVLSRGQRTEDKTQMQTETFMTEREFRSKYPVDLFECPMCGKPTTSAIYCSNCGFRADGIVGTLDKGLRYKIEDTGEEREIFKPICRQRP